MLSDGSSLVGREQELMVVRNFLAGESAGPRSLVIEGPAGIGKTHLWEAGIGAARAQGLSILSSRPSNEDAALDFVGLADVFAHVHLDQLDPLPAPQRRALEAALLLREGHETSDSRAVFTAVRTAFAALARESRLLVAIDDVQWLDRASASALAFAARRLDGREICFLLTERLDPAGSGPSPLDRGLDVERLAVTPLSYGAITTLLHERLRLTLTRPVARRLHDVSGGNPLFALELGRALAGSVAAGNDAPHEPPLPSKVQDALADRVAALTAPAGRALLAASLSPGITSAELIAVVGDRAVGSAIDAGVLVLDAERVRPSHPMIGEVASARADAGALRSLHRRMAAAAHDEERRALHLSLGTLGQDGAIAAVVATAAAAAARRGASGTAADLGRRALELTPRAAPEWVERLLDAAEYDYVAGELVRAARLLEPELDSLPAGLPRARALYVLAVVGPLDAQDVYVRFEQALDAAAEPTPLRARILTHFARDIAIGQLRSPAEAEARASQAIEICRRCRNPRQERHALVSLMWARALGGHSIDDLLERHDALPADSFSPYVSAERITALTKLWRGELRPARTQFEWLLAQADERGETEGYFAIRLQLCELELRAGRWDRVSVFLEEWAQERGEMIGHQTAYLRCRAHLAAGRGNAAEAIRLADEVIAADRTVDVPWHRLESLRARGIGALLAGDPRAACESLEPVENHLRAHGIDNPGAFPIGAELAEALSLTGSVERAREVAERLAARSEAQDNPWAAAAAARAFGHVALAERDHAHARELFADAAERFAALELGFDRARSLVGLGVAQRRMRSKREARGSFEEAVAEFERLGSPGWSVWARRELSRLGGRAPSGGRLTPTERRVAELVAQGLANKQVAAAMVVTDRTVEAHLTRIYAKLGVRSRTELTRWLSGSR